LDDYQYQLNLWVTIATWVTIRQEELVKRCDAFKAKQEEMFLGRW
jgi:hypothetical protein